MNTIGASTATLVDRYALAPEEIEARSLAAVNEALIERFSDPEQRAVAARIVYAAGDLDLAAAIRVHPDAISAGVTALRRSAPIVVDVRMVLAGLSRRHTDALGCPLHCLIDDPAVVRRAQANGLPRAVEAVRALAPVLDGAIAVIGNAPTALLSLLDLIDSERARPALVIGMPVGFVAAAESKQSLLERDLPSITISGTRGGSPLATATANALLRLAEPEPATEDRSRTAILFLGHGSRAADSAAGMLAAIERVRRRGVYPIVEPCFLELAEPDLPEGIRRCVKRGANRIAIVPYFLHRGMHIRRDIPNVLRQEAERYPGLCLSLGAPIGLHVDLADVMLSGAIETTRMPDIRDMPACTGACTRGEPPLACCTFGLVQG